MEGFLLGLSSGTICLAHCAPVLVPYFLGEGSYLRRNIVDLAEFLSGRLIGYLLFGLVAWLTGQILFDRLAYRELFFGGVYIILALFLAYYGLFVSRDYCLVKSLNGAVNRLVTRQKWMLTVSLGLLTGINFCPPFLLAFTSSTYSSNLLHSLFFFFTFFLGTSLYFLPMVFIGFFKGFDRLKTIGKMTAVVMSLYFLYRGTMMIIGSLIIL